MKKATINKINIVTKGKRSYHRFKWDVVYFALVVSGIYFGYIGPTFILIGLYMHKRLL